MVVYLPAGARRWRTPSARGEALPSAGRKVFRKPTSCQESGKFSAFIAVWPWTWEWMSRPSGKRSSGFSLGRFMPPLSAQCRMRWSTYNQHVQQFESETPAEFKGFETRVVATMAG
jgi:hypothetical protein